VEEGLVSELSLSRAACRHDSGVASPTEEFHTAKEETKTITASGERPAQRKARLNSGEDAGIGGSDHGEPCIRDIRVVELVYILCRSGFYYS